jgi:hypothetical protein
LICATKQDSDLIAPNRTTPDDARECTTLARDLDFSIGISDIEQLSSPAPAQILTVWRPAGVKSIPIQLDQKRERLSLHVPASTSLLHIIPRPESL